MNGLSKEDRKVLKAAFNKYDRNKDGTLTVQEFTLFLTKLSKHVPQLCGVEMDEVEAVMQLLSNKKSLTQSITFDDFCGWWSQSESTRYSFFTGEKSELLRKAYGIYKLHTSGGKGMSYIQYERMMDEIGLPYTDCDFDQLDTDGDGILSFEEFCLWLNWF